MSSGRLLSSSFRHFTAGPRMLDSKKILLSSTDPSEAERVSVYLQIHGVLTPHAATDLAQKRAFFSTLVRQTRTVCDTESLQ
jgi:hypothetical protein